MKKYLLIGDGESPHLFKWAKELSKYFEMYVVSSRSFSPDLRSIIPEENCHEFGLSPEERGGNFQYIKLIRPLRKLIAYISPDFVNAHYITSHGVLAALAERPSKRNYKLILTAWGTDIQVTPFKNPFYRIITRFALNRADLVTTDSKVVAGIVEKLSTTQTTTFPFGLDKLPDVKPEDKDPNLYFSNRTLNTNANIDKVLTFFAKVHSENNEARLIIANDGPEKEYLIDWSHDLGILSAVEFTGFISEEEQQEIYKKAMYYFSILSSDALSVSLLEALAYGCIPIVSDLPDNIEYVTNGLNGIVLDKSNAIDSVVEIRQDALNIFEINRRLISKKAIFPDAIKDFCKTIATL